MHITEQNSTQSECHLVDTCNKGVRVPVSKSRYRNFDSLLDDLNANIQMPFGVRRLTTPMGRTSIHDIDELQHLGK
ncbi:hypothetical protein ANCCAN_22326 [Ancylostoma caninum]|uniref:Doublecortin domain-containing protein n=1 Tax=Ancylostoma caninum TaxID=29170 RepID=A0A368FIK2_ANCCA|nr:hypothetical protein ANCCAN_22326 [Ancylostoma caninum]